MKKYIFLLATYFVLVSVSYAEPTGEILTFPANPAKGFYWEYMLYLPQTMDISQKLPILLTMTNTGKETDSVEKTKEDMLSRFQNLWDEPFVADELGVPLVIPIVQRPVDFYTHDLSRAVFVSQELRFKRLDLQVLKMLQDARKQLRKRHIKTKRKFLVTGFSAAGVFAWRWTMLHPEYVLATAIGGALYHMLPVEEWNGETLIYPIGVGDLKQYVGKKFNKKAWSKIPIFSANGERDDNDTFVWEVCFAKDVERPVLQKVLPGRDVFERRTQSLQLLAQLAPNVQTHLYPWIGHKSMPRDAVRFLRRHFNGGPLRPITPIDTSNQKPQPAKIVRATWGDDSQISAKYHINANYLALETGATYPAWVYRAYGKIAILCDGQVVINPTNKGSVSVGEKSFFLFDLNLRPEERKYWRDKKCKWSVRSLEPEMLKIPSDLTFSIP